MRWFRSVVALLAFGLSTVGALAAATSVRLILPVSTVKPGDSFTAAVELSSQPGWHTYWRHGGDAGAPTQFEWRLPPGITAGDVLWPAPERFEENDLVTYVFHGTTLLLIPFTVGPQAQPGPVEIAATAKWLECKESCIPRKADTRASLVIGPSTTPSPDDARLRAALAALPQPLPANAASAAWDGPATGEERTLVIQWKAPVGPGLPDFFPNASDTHIVAPATERAGTDSPGVTLRKKVRKLEGAWPAEIAGLLVRFEPGKRPHTAFEARLPILDKSGTTPPPPSPTTPPSNPTPAAAAGGSPKPAALSFLGAVGFAFIGGLILNIMPCVLPVIALKILGFVRQAGSHPAEIRKLGVIYALGVWFSFLVLAGVVIAVKNAAGFASWGMQFGNPIFLVVLTTLILLVSLSLFGVYEINLGGGALDAAGDLASKEGPAGAFFNGMLAVALATPCTAPFLAPALGYAFTASASTVVLIFSAVAFGLASPYVVLSWQPAWLRFLPKPGHWMVRFKVAMGFPMLATTLWLYTLTSNHFGESGPLWLGIFLLGIALSAWVWGEFVQRGRSRQALAMTVALALAAGSYATALENELHWRSPRKPSSRSQTTAPSDADHIAWQPWSREAVEAARKAGRPVFVDFTADWCATCIANERISINIASVRERLKAIQAVTLKGDYTLLPPEITEELQRHGRAGVPLVLVYPKNPSLDPQVLPEFLTPGVVLEALERAAR